MTNVFDRPLPQDIDAERAALGSMIIAADAISDVRAVLTNGASEFSRESHGMLFSVLVSMLDANAVIDGQTIRAEFIRVYGAETWERLGKYTFLTDKYDAVPSALRAEYYARLVHDKWLLREGIAACYRAAQKLGATNATAADALAYAEDRILAVTERRVTNGAESLGTTIGRAYADAERPGGAAVPTLFPALDNLLGGLKGGDLIIVAARPSHGKSSLVFSMADRMGSAGIASQIASVEMSAASVACRFLSMRSGIPMRALFAPDLTPAQLESRENARDTIARLPIHIDDASGPTVGDIRAKTRIAVRRNNVAILFVDYLQLVHGDGRYQSRETDVSAVSRGLKAIAKDLAIPVIAVAQLNRGPEKRTDPKPKPSDLRESGAIEQDADVIILLHREWQTDGAWSGSPPPCDDVSVNVGKHRNGETGEVHLSFERVTMRFCDSAHDVRPADTVRDPSAPRSVAEAAQGSMGFE